MTNPTVSTVALDEIDFSDTTYKISKPQISEQLIQSMRRFGILEAPVLFREKNHFIILCGHNRLSAAKNIGRNREMCRILEDFDPKIFFQLALKKLYHSEIGPIGKIKLYHILKKYETVISINAEDFAIKELSIPEYILSSREIAAKALSLPPFVAEYLEMKEPGFKTIRDILQLSDFSIAILNNWITAVPMRINIFRQIAELLYDIERKNFDGNQLREIQIPAEGDPRQKETFLLTSLMGIRYPLFLKRRSEADALLAVLQKIGVHAEFPEFFEGDAISFTINIRKKEGIDALFKKIEKIDKETVKKLFDLL